MASTVVLDKVNKYYGKNHIVRDLSLDVQKGEFLTLLGPSGCGKTTTLRMIGGFEIPDQGEVYLNGKSVTELDPNKRDVNTVFQNYALFPHMTVTQNIEFGLKMQKLEKNERLERVNKVLKMVQMESFAKRKPREMSGGQQQRIAVARAIVNNPSVLLLDEPLGALDLKLRKEMQIELKHLQKSLGMTFIYVTHDQEEALTMSDRIAIMYGGEIAQLDAPEEIYFNPTSIFVADFIGETNMLKAQVTHFEGKMMTINLFGHQFTTERKEGVQIGSEVTVSIRPEAISLTNEQPFLTGKVVETIFVGSIRKIVVALENGTNIVVMTDDAAVHLKDEVVGLGWKRKPVVLVK